MKSFCGLDAVGDNLRRSVGRSRVATELAASKWKTRQCDRRSSSLARAAGGDEGRGGKAVQWPQKRLREMIHGRGQNKREEEDLVPSVGQIID